MAEPVPLQVEMWFDVICPWCRIGLVQLERAAASRPGLRVELTLRSFRLHRDWPAEGMAWRRFQAERGLPDAVFHRVEAAGRAHGLEFDFSRAPLVPDTAPLHRLILWAEEFGQGRALYDAFSAAYFDRAENLASPATLLAIVAGLGLPATAAAAAMETAGALERSEAEAARLGISGVPHFRIDGRLGLSGAAGATVLLRAMDAVVA